MRHWLVSVVVLAGCLRGPASALDPTHARRAPFEIAWARHLSFGQYAEAAKVARESELGPAWIERAWQLARRQASAALAAYASESGVPYTEKIRNLIDAHRQVLIVACRHAPPGTFQLQAINDAVLAYFSAWQDGLLFLLLEEKCPLRPDQHFSILSAAAEYGGGWKELALHYAVDARWDALYKSEFVKRFLRKGDCSFGLKAASRLGLPPAELARAFEDAACEGEDLTATEWIFSQEELRQLFFAAVRARKYHLAITLNLLALGGENGVRYIIQELFRARQELSVDRLLEKHPGLREPIYEYALAHGRARFVGMHARDGCWERAAFEQLLRGGQFENAAEVAEFGQSEAFRAEGILRAFRAAAVKDMLVARYLRRRYPAVVSTSEYETARKAWNLAHPDDKRFPAGPKKIPRKRHPECDGTASEDWRARRCD